MVTKLFRNHLRHGKNYNWTDGTSYVPEKLKKICGASEFIRVVSRTKPSEATPELIEKGRISDDSLREAFRKMKSPVAVQICFGDKENPEIREQYFILPPARIVGTDRVEGYSMHIM